MNNKKNFILGLAALVSAFLLSNCTNPIAEMVKLAKDQQLTVDPNPLELHGSQVGFTMSAKLPVAMMKKGTKYTLEVSYVPGDIETVVDLKPIEEISKDAIKVGAIPFDGDKYQGQTEDPKVSKEFSFAYEDKFETGGLMVKGIATKLKNNKSKEFGPVRMRVADGGFVKGVATTQRLVKGPADGINPTSGETPFAYADHAFTATGPTTEEFPIFFNQGSAVVMPNVASNKAAMDVVSGLFTDTEVPPFEASGTSSHSPEGSEAVNTRLADDRAVALEKAFKAMVSKFDYAKKQLDAYKFNFDKKVLGETVPEFNSLVDQSSLSPEQKAEAKEILGRDGDFVENELELHNKPYYKTLFDEVYPKLRYAKTGVSKPGATKSLETLSAMVAQIKEGKLTADKLTESEYLYSAANTPDLDERLSTLQKAAEVYQTWKVHNNIGAAYLDMALLKSDMSKVDMAIPQFEASMGKKETGEAAYNLALAYSMKGDNAKMEEYLQKAANLGSSDANISKLINGAKAYLAIKAAGARDDGKYKEAEDLLGNTVSTNPNLFNKGLAQLLQGTNYDAAVASFTSAAQKNPKDAKTQYALAIAYARKGDEGNMASALKKACEMDSNWKTKAVKDVEFDKFKNAQGFKDAIK
ncbi:MAG: tetratricopeptide repeat protein [Microscillaceae bacterium]|nr:tetratricopeptide repeat protein [Microscillaceae bacterium]